MNHRIQPSFPDRSGLTLLELIATLVISATLLTSSMIVMRSSYTAWQTHEVDADLADTADAAIRHFVRTIRQARSVSAIHKDPINSDSSLEVVTADGLSHRYAANNNTLQYATQLSVGLPLTYESISNNISWAGFTAYEADGATETTVVEDIHLIHFEVRTPSVGGGAESTSSYAWVRSW